VAHGRDVLVGLVIVCAVLVGAVGTFFLRGAAIRRNLTPIEAVVLEAGQLMDGNAVKFRGVEIGRVEAIRVEPGGEAVRINMRVDRDATFPDDAGVILSPESMFGDWQVEIVSRSDFPRYEFLAEPSSGAIPGYTLPDMSRLTAAADEIADNLTVLTDRVELAFTEETAMNLKAAIDNIQNVSRNLSDLVGQQAQSFESLTTEVSTSAEEFGAASREARESFEMLQSALEEGQADSLVADARVAIGNLRDLSGRLAESAEGLDRTLESADSTFARLDRIGATIERGEGSIGRLLGDTTLALRAEEALTQLTELLADFRENPRRYVRLTIF
jgi:phospholipid/cholesterol/gamma-HCH transport system substrate-binding protein